MRFETQAIHKGQEPEPQTGAVIPPIFATSTFAQIEPGKTRGYDYTRSGNPNFTRLGETLAALESARYATLFASGMSAVTAVLSTLKSGDKILAEENIYGCTYRILDKVFEKYGLTVEYVDFSREENLDLIQTRKPTLVWIESPTNPLLKVIDIAALSNRCQRSGIPLVVDNTFASPYFQKPIELGATLSLSSATKYINGHSDCLGGVVCTNDEAWQEKMIFAQKAIGLQPSPFDCWLIQRGVKTLAVRMRQHAANAMAVAEFLEQRSETRFVRYPFLKSHPQVEVAKKQMSGGSGIVTAVFDLNLEQTVKLVSNMKLFRLAESLGGVESLICHPASMTHASVPREQREKVGITDGLVRFSVGIEDQLDLIEDIQSALESLQ